MRLFFIQVANKKRERLLMADSIGQGKKDLANAYVAGAAALYPGWLGLRPCTRVLPVNK